MALLARGEKGLAGAAAEVSGAGARALVVPTDVADHEQVFAAAARIEREAGPIDVWVNSAFTSVFAPFDQIEPQEYRRVTEVSYLGYVYATMAALKYMKPRDRGTIVQVGSALAYRGIPLLPGGTASALPGGTASRRRTAGHRATDAECSAHSLGLQGPECRLSCLSELGERCHFEDASYRLRTGSHRRACGSRCRCSTVRT